MTPRRPPRIAPIPQPTPEQAELLAQTVAREGAPPPNLFRTLVRHPTLMKRTNILAGMFLTKGQLPARERELAILRVASRSACEYEFEQHRRIALDCGLAIAEIDAVRDEDGAHEWAPPDRALLRFVDALLDEADVSDERWAPVAALHADEELLELLLLVGFYRMLAAFLNAVGVPLDDPPADV